MPEEIKQKFTWEIEVSEEQRELFEQAFVGYISYRPEGGKMIIYSENIDQDIEKIDLELRNYTHYFKN